jgi:tetratricopeptide (TPR) repeat protein
MKRKKSDPPPREADILNFRRGGMESMLSGLANNIEKGGREHTALERAQEIMYGAWEEADARKRIALAIEALTVSPDCADAHVLLAEELATSYAEALEHYTRGVEAGERAFGKEFENFKGHFWGIVETRPYLRALMGKAQSLWGLGEREKSIAVYQEMIDLNPNDNQGVRDVLLSGLIELQKDDEARKLLKRYKDDSSAVWAYSRALLAYRKDGDSAGSRKYLAAALVRNVHVPDFLLGKERIPKTLPDMISFGDESEAVAYAGDNIAAWRNTFGALGWLRDFMANKTKE